MLGLRFWFGMFSETKCWPDAIAMLTFMFNFQKKVSKEWIKTIKKTFGNVCLRFIHDFGRIALTNGTARARNEITKPNALRRRVELLGFWFLVWYV